MEDLDSLLMAPSEALHPSPLDLDLQDLDLSKLSFAIICILSKLFIFLDLDKICMYRGAIKLN